MEMRMDALQRDAGQHAALGCHAGFDGVIARVAVVEKKQLEHESQAGHSSHADLLSRISRLEMGIASSLVGIVILIIKDVLTPK